MEKRIPPHYLDQTNWGTDEFSSLNSYLNRLFLYESDPEKSLTIAQMDRSRMSRETLALIGAILVQYDKLALLCDKYPNLQCAELTAPLSEPLFLNESHLDLFPAYRHMNIHY